MSTDEPPPAYEEYESQPKNNDPENPPTYQESRDTPMGVNDPPPSYDSIFGKVKQAKADSSGNVDFICKLAAMTICGVACCGIYIAILLALPIAMIVIGAMYLEDCPRERYIPIYLIVAGAFGVVKAISNIIQQICKRKKNEEDTEQNKKPNPCDSVISTFLLAWFIAGCVWTYRVYDDYQSVDPTLDNYCNETVYLFTFWLLNITWILLGLAFVCCCCGICIACFVSKD